MNITNQKRITVMHKHPNPLFAQWLTEWRDKAKERESKMQHCFQLALTSLKKYPLPLETGKDCKILKGFGEKLCNMLDDKLKEYKAANGKIPKPQTTEIRKTHKKTNNSPKKEYIPVYRSGAFAILVAMFQKSSDPGYAGFMTKNEIIADAQNLCDVSFTKPGPDTRYTGWSSMKTLLEKKLVTKESNPAKFRLTNEGSTLADKLYIQQKIEEFKKMEEEEIFNKSQDCVSLPSSSGMKQQKTGFLLKKDVPIWKQTSTSSSTTTTYETVILAPSSFEIVLIVDTQELSGGKEDSDMDPTIKELKKLNVKYEIRNLKVGDYTWICKDNFGNELVLPYIIERKRMDDLGSSIKDSRFHEQKFRLKQSGIPNLIYLIENHGRNTHCGLPINTLYQAAINTLVHDGFNVQFTENGKASCEYLACLTDFIRNVFKGKTLVSCSKEDIPPLSLDEDLIHLMVFKDFNKGSTKAKHFKVKEMFVRTLLQIKGMSVDKALAIVEKYPTPLLLKLEYSGINEAQGEKLLATISYGSSRKNVGAVLSKTVYQFFNNVSY